MGDSENGVCAIKPEFIIKDHIRKITLDTVSEKDKKILEENSHSKNTEDTTESTEKAEKTENGPPEKRQKRQLSKRERKKLRGQNKRRPTTFQDNKEHELCHKLFDICQGDQVPVCQNDKCLNLHDIEKYLEIKPKDIGENCVNYEIRGRCPQGLACRFGSKHISPEGKNILNLEINEKYKKLPNSTLNQITKELQMSLRKRNYDFSHSENCIRKIDKIMNYNRNEKFTKKSTCGNCENFTRKDQAINNLNPEKGDNFSGCVTDEDLIKVRDVEKKKISWAGKLYLSPLTTVGNLPFRRICKEYGADVTCGEMALASNLVQGTYPEWALVKRHSSEDIFGVQLCGNNPHMVAKAAELLKNNAQVDFVDLNLGCPIDLIYRQGAGCGLLRRQRVLESIVRSVTLTLGDIIPFTCKTRMGVYTDEPMAHELAPKLSEWGASMITVHGRSREQRYTKMADWSYIDKCASAASPTPVFGNGDILSYHDYDNVVKEYKNISGVMIGRGALIKPWIFQEIKERKLYDISAGERLDIIQKYVNYGLEHWGSDSKGVETTRRFLLEWLSFLYRFIPVGVLEQPPQKINHRPPSYRGRDDLETLLASSACQDWIKISEMFLGTVPENFHFLPKHKANSFK